MPRALNLVLGALLMLAITLAFAFATMRLAIHGTQVEVPSIVTLTADDAQHRLAARGLNLVTVSRFYSATVPAGHIISQVPAPGVIVRQEWEVRAIESLGPQKVSIPDVRGMPERPAAITIRRLSLDLGTLAHLPAPGDADLVLAQTPPPNASGVDSPRINLLVSQKEDAAVAAFVMPSLIGLSYSAAAERAASLGLAVYATQPSAATPDPANPHPTDAVQPVSTGGTITSQSPQSGFRVQKGQTIRLTLGGNASAQTQP